MDGPERVRRSKRIDNVRTKMNQNINDKKISQKFEYKEVSFPIDDTSFVFYSHHV